LDILSERTREIIVAKNKIRSVEEQEVEKLYQPEADSGNAHWKSYSLYFTSGELTGKLHGYLIVGSTVPMDNINAVTLAGCNVKAMDLRASDQIVNKKNVDPS
jgi:hypothetical protein